MKQIFLQICIFLIHSTLTQSKIRNFGWIHNPWRINSGNDEVSQEINLEISDQNERYPTLIGFEMKENIIKKLMEMIDRDDLPNNQKCFHDIKIWISDIKQLKMYALQMKDSWGARQRGMLEGNARWMGRYWECVNAMGQNFKGKFCSTYYGFRYIPQAPIPYDIQISSCFPDSCDEEIIQNLTTTEENLRLPSLNTKCSYQNNSTSGFYIATIVLSAVFLLFAIFGTLNDVLRRSQKSKPSHNSAKNRFLMCFSVIRNGEKILDTKRSPGHIDSLDGIRVISTIWVVLGHTGAFSLTYMDNIIVLNEQIKTRFGFMVLLNASFSVDTFFCIGGLLISYLTLKHLNTTKKYLNMALMLLQRYLRLTPLYAYVLVFSTGVYNFMGSGPFWGEASESIVEGCYNEWWTNLLYINNLYPVSNPCFTHGWYLACDMQFFIVSLFLIYLIYKSPKLGVLITTLLAMTSIGITWWLSRSSSKQPMVVTQANYLTIASRLIPPTNTTNDTNEKLSYQDRFKSDLYITPWCRVSVYLIGVLAGYILYASERKIKISKILAFVGWILASGTAVSIIYGPFALTQYSSQKINVMDVDVAAFYNAVTRPAWGLCIAWVVIACTCGFGGPATKFLNWSFFLPLSRLTYALYLVHIFIVYWNITVQEQYIHFSLVWFAYTYIGNVVISLMFAFLVALLVEWPCQELLRILLPSRKSSPSHQFNLAPLTTIEKSWIKEETQVEKENTFKDFEEKAESYSIDDNNEKTNPCYASLENISTNL